MFSIKFQKMEEYEVVVVAMREKLFQTWQRVLPGINGSCRLLTLQPCSVRHSSLNLCLL